jgi:hypothetical protein
MRISLSVIVQPDNFMYCFRPENVTNCACIEILILWRITLKCNCSHIAAKKLSRKSNKMFVNVYSTSIHTRATHGEQFAYGHKL